MGVLNAKQYIRFYIMQLYDFKIVTNIFHNLAISTK